MAYTPVRLYQGQPGTSETTLLAAITGNRIIKQIIITNTSATTSSLSLSLVPSGGTAGVANRIISGYAISGVAAVTFDLSQVMTSGDFLSGLQTVSGALTITISGVSY